MLNQRRSARGSRRSLSPTAALHRFAYLLPRLSISERTETSGLAAADASSAALQTFRMASISAGWKFEYSGPPSGSGSGNWFIAQMAACVRLATWILRRMAFDVDLDGRLGDVELAGDRLVGVSLTQASESAEFLVRKLRRPTMFRLRFRSGTRCQIRRRGVR